MDDKQLGKARQRDRALADELWQAVHGDVAARGDDVIGLAMRAMNRLGKVLTKRGLAIVYGERNAHPFDECLTRDKLFALDGELLAALLRPYVRKSAPNVELPVAACNARRAYELVKEHRADADGIVRRTYRPADGPPRP